MTEIKDIAKGEIGNALTSTASNHIVAVADEIYDEEQKGYQSEINKETKKSIKDLAHKMSEIDKETIETEEDSIDIEDNNGNKVFHLGEDGLDAKNVRSNGKPVLTEHQDISPILYKTSNIKGNKTSEYESVIIEDNDGNVIAEITSDSSTFNNLKSNGEDVLTKKDIVKEISHKFVEEENETIILATDNGDVLTEVEAKLVSDDDECQSWNSNDYDDEGHGEQYAKITPAGVSAKGFFDLNGNPIGTTNIKVTQLYAYRQEGTDDATHFYGLNAIKKALASITDASAENRYVINVRGRFIFNDISNHDVLVGGSIKNTSNTWWANVYGKDYVTLDGGDKEQTSVEMYLSLDTVFPKWDDGVHGYYGGNYHVIFNNAIWFECKNITFVGRNTRYCLHNESFNEIKGSYQLFENCRFVYGYDGIWTSSHVNVTGTIFDGNTVLGCGYRKEGDIHYKDCDVIANSSYNMSTTGVGSHSGFYANWQTYDKPAKILFSRCNFVGMKRMVSYSSYQPIGDIFRFESCNIPNLATVNLSVIQYSDHDNPLAYPKVYMDRMPLVINNMSSAEVNVLKLVATTGTSSIIRVDKTSSAFGIIADSTNGSDGINEWGAYQHDGYIYKDDEHGLDGYLLGTAGIGKRTLGGILGDCSSSNKILKVIVNGVTKSCTFNADMTSMSNADVINYINARLEGVEVSLANLGDYYYPTFDGVNLIENNGTKTVKKGMGVMFDTNTITFRIATQTDKYVDGICIDDTPVGQLGRVASCGMFALRPSSVDRYVNIKTEDYNGRFFVIGSTDGVFKSTNEYSNVKKIWYNQIIIC